MTLCRSCGHATLGNVPFCEGCGRTFNARLCPSKHKSSPSATFCGTCGSDELSNATGGRRLNISNRLLRALVIFCLIKVSFPYALPIIRFLLSVVASTLRFLFGIDFPRVIWPLLRLLVLWSVIWLMLYATGGEKIKALKLYERISVALASWLIASLKTTWRLAMRMASSSKPKEAK